MYCYILAFITTTKAYEFNYPLSANTSHDQELYLNQQTLSLSFVGTLIQKYPTESHIGHISLSSST